MNIDCDICIQYEYGALVRSIVREDLVVPGKRTEWSSRAVDGLSCWNELPVELMDLSVRGVPRVFGAREQTSVWRTPKKINL